MRLAYGLIFGTLVVFVGCKDGGDKGPTGSGGGGAAGSTAGAAGNAAGASGAGGSSGGRGGGSGSSSTVLTSCPPSRPTPGTACTGDFTCNYDVMCICGTCCVYGYQCQSGTIVLLGFNDACMQVNPLSCRDGGSDATGDAANDANADVRATGCTPGAHQTCNDNPAVSSIRGTCTDAGTCICNNDAAPAAGSGRCP